LEARFYYVERMDGEGGDDAGTESGRGFHYGR
jgi:hypothetical protein